MYQALATHLVAILMRWKDRSLAGKYQEREAWLTVCCWSTIGVLEPCWRGDHRKKGLQLLVCGETENKIGGNMISGLDIPS